MNTQKALLVECFNGEKSIYSKIFFNKENLVFGRSARCDIVLPFKKTYLANVDDDLLSDVNVETFHLENVLIKITRKTLKEIELGKPESLKRSYDVPAYEIVTFWKGQLLETFLIFGASNLNLFAGSQEMLFTNNFEFTRPNGFSYESNNEGTRHILKKGNRTILITRKRKDAPIARPKFKVDKLMMESYAATAVIVFAIGFVSTQLSPNFFKPKSQTEDIIPEKLIKLSLDRIEAVPPPPAGGSSEYADSSDAVQKSGQKNLENTVAKTQSRIKNLLAGLMANPISDSAKSIAVPVGNPDATNNSKLVAVATSINSGVKSDGVKLGIGGGRSPAHNGGVGKTSGSGLGNMLGYSIGKISAEIANDEAKVDGGLSKEIIASIINSNLGQIKHCYERQLTIQPDLFGKIVIGWRINQDGSVAETIVKNTTMKSNPVENCMKRKIDQWKFPEPKGGGIVDVTYPFLFKATS